MGHPQDSATPSETASQTSVRAGRVRLVAEDATDGGGAAPDPQPRPGWDLLGVLITALVIGLMVGALVIILLGVFQVKPT